MPGNPFACGFEHGRACRTEIRSFLADGLAGIDTLRPRPLGRERALSLAKRYGEAIREDMPDLHAELLGLAEGAGILPEEACLLQVRRELIAATGVDAHGCSLMAHDPGGFPCLSQTIDLEGGVADLVRVFRILPDAGPEILMLSLAGLLGYLGMNSYGLAIGINMVLSDGWMIGVSPYLAVRYLLTRKTIDECIAVLGQLRISSSRSLTFLQGGRCVNAELTPGGHSLREGLPSFHTNHYLHPRFEAADRLHPISRNTSRIRLELLRERFRSHGPNDAEACFSILSDHSLWPAGICMHAQGIKTRPETVAAIAMIPAKGEFHVRRGRVCEAKTETYAMNMRSRT